MDDLLTRARMLERRISALERGISTARRDLGKVPTRIPHPHPSTIAMPIDPSGNFWPCSHYFLYVWNDLNLAAMMDPFYGWYQDGGKIWNAETDGTENNPTGFEQLLGKESWTRVRVTSGTELPTMTTATRVRFAIYVARVLWYSSNWNTWANNWLDSTDRTEATIEGLLEGVGGTAAKHAMRCALAYVRGLDDLAAEYAAETAFYTRIFSSTIDLPALAAQAIADE